MLGGRGLTPDAVFQLAAWRRFLGAGLGPGWAGSPAPGFLCYDSSPYQSMSFRHQIKKKLTKGDEVVPAATCRSLGQGTGSDKKGARKVTGTLRYYILVGISPYKKKKQRKASEALIHPADEIKRDPRVQVVQTASHHRCMWWWKKGTSGLD